MEQNEPSISWAKSEAKGLLQEDICQGQVPKTVKDASGKRIATLKEIYDRRPECALYKCSKFSSRLSRLRAAIKHQEDGSFSEDSDCNNNDGNKKKTAKKKKEKSESKIKWGRSNAKRLLYFDIQEERVVGEGADAAGKRTKNLNELHNSRPEFALYQYSKFLLGLSSLRATVKDWDARAALDQEAFEIIAANHLPLELNVYMT